MDTSRCLGGGQLSYRSFPLAPLLKNTKKVGFPEDPFPDIPMDPKAPYRIKEGEKADFHRLTYLYKQEISAQCLVAFYDKCEEKRVVDRFTTRNAYKPRERRNSSNWTWRVAEEAPPPPEDVNNLTWEHFPVIEDSPEEPQTPEEEVQEPSILSIGPHEITYKRKTTQDAEDTDTHSPLMKEVNACQHLIERVIGAIERMENIVARQDEQLTARSQGGQQLPQQSGTSQPHRSSWQGFQDHASQERRRKKRKPRKKQRKQQTQEDIRVQENAPQQREATSQPQRRRFRTQETTVEQRQDQRRNTWNPPQHHPQRNARVNRGRGTQQTPPQDFQRRPYPHQGFRRREWYPQPSEEQIQVAGTEEPPQGKKTQHGKQIQWLGRPSKRKLPVGNRKKRRKTVARRRSKQLGMELVVSEVPLERIHFSVLHKGAWPGRPVLSGCSSPTRPVDRLLTTYLTPLLDLLPKTAGHDLLSTENERCKKIPRSHLIFLILSLFTPLSHRRKQLMW
ncbi:hypothetical protein C7M84_019562 [Penaeus vannamei]|uniref:Uncharacterized protein n=1 Tax=Penaeus vannamei TaxID=6689 RepID=A0A423SED2_PENVA|nr:hypothetical protein C7M84_019562 [Penaeus vannamei]